MIVCVCDYVKRKYQNIGVNKDVSADVSWYRVLIDLKEMRTTINITDSCKNREAPFLNM
jgi:hypothetical protein